MAGFKNSFLGKLLLQVCVLYTVRYLTDGEIIISCQNKLIRRVLITVFLSLVSFKKKASSGKLQWRVCGLIWRRGFCEIT